MHCRRCQWVAVLAALSCLPINIYLHRRQAELGETSETGSNSADSMVEEAFGEIHSSLGEPIGLLKPKASVQRDPLTARVEAASRNKDKAGPPPVKPLPKAAPPAAHRAFITLGEPTGAPKHHSASQRILPSRRNATTLAMNLREQLLGRSRSHSQASAHAEMKSVRGADAQRKKESAVVQAAKKKPLGDMPPPELRSVQGVEDVGLEEHREQSKQTANYHDLLQSAKGAVSRCRNERAERRPNIMELPLQLSRYVAFDDVFVHQGNFRRILGRGNFSDLKYPGLLPKSAKEIYSRFGFDSCATVGNSGSMLYSKFGSVIDTHKVVFRVNQAPTKGYTEYVGKHTTFRLLNSLWTHRYGTTRQKAELAKLKDALWGSMGFTDEKMLDATELPLEKDATLVVSRCSVKQYSDLQLFWYRRRRDVQVLMLNSRIVSVVRALAHMYRVRLCRAGWGPFEGGADPSSGLVAAYIAHQLCGTCSVYGFGTERVTQSNERTPYHYYKFYGARAYGNSKAHSFDTELNMMAEMYNASEPFPFPGHRLHDTLAPSPGQVRYCRAQPGYVANVHNTKCKGGWAEPDKGHKLRSDGHMSVSEIYTANSLHRSWQIPLPITEVT